ncbi:MAG: hypothetical protein C4560_01310 [Nitrospiraceae bacterium]|nr:MAG: hypothetical protein C4560_01310 [Nitrospiraceae bacterium]
MVFKIDGEVISKSGSKKGGDILNILVDRPDRSGRDVIAVFMKGVTSHKVGDLIELQVSSFVKMAYEA